MERVSISNVTNFASTIDNTQWQLDTLHPEVVEVDVLNEVTGRVIRSAKQKCPPVKVNKGFSPFAFLAFILISVNTIMNISNNISNNNNNRNNNNVSTS